LRANAKMMCTIRRKEGGGRRARTDYGLAEIAAPGGGKGRGATRAERQRALSRSLRFSR
jgi:hypothetical protein